jgi:hypothetical protein
MEPRNAMIHGLSVDPSRRAPPADAPPLVEDHHVAPRLGQRPRRGQARHASADDHDHDHLPALAPNASLLGGRAQAGIR